MYGFPLIPIPRDVLLVLRESLRTLGNRQILTEDQYDALLHLNAKLREQEK